MTVTARDGAEEYLQGTCTFIITVEDKNDNAPIFDKPLYDQAVSLGKEINSEILRVTATDADINENSELRYSLDGDNDDKSYFNIDSTTGFIKLNKELSQEMVRNSCFETIYFI